MRHKIYFLGTVAPGVVDKGYLIFECGSMAEAHKLASVYCAAIYSSYITSSHEIPTSNYKPEKSTS